MLPGVEQTLHSYMARIYMVRLAVIQGNKVYEIFSWVRVLGHRVAQFLEMLYASVGQAAVDQVALR